MKRLRLREKTVPQLLCLHCPAIVESWPMRVYFSRLILFSPIAAQRACTNSPCRNDNSCSRILCWTKISSVPRRSVPSRVWPARVSPTASVQAASNCSWKICRWNPRLAMTRVMIFPIRSGFLLFCIKSFCGKELHITINTLIL